MWWPLRRRARGRHAAGRVVFIGHHGPLEPWAPEDLDLVALQHAATVLDDVALPGLRESLPPAAPPAQPAPPRLPAVGFGFADGSSLELTADHPAAIALRAVADRLVAVAD